MAVDKAHAEYVAGKTRGLDRFHNRVAGCPCGQSRSAGVALAFLAMPSPFVLLRHDRNKPSVIRACCRPFAADAAKI